MDVSEYNKILLYKKLSKTSSKLLTRREQHFRTKLRLFTMQDGKLYKNGKQVLHSEDAYPTLLKAHQAKSHPNRVQLERLARGMYHVEILRPSCQRIVTQLERCQFLLFTSHYHPHNFRPTSNTLIHISVVIQIDDNNANQIMVRFGAW